MRNAFNTQVGKKGNKSTLTGQEITETQIWRNINSLGNKGMEQLKRPGNKETATSSKGQNKNNLNIFNLREHEPYKE